MKNIFMQYHLSFVFVTALSQADHITLHSDILLFSGEKPWLWDASPQPVGHQQKEGRIQVGSKWSPYCRLYQEDAVPSRQRQKIKRWTSAISLVLPLALHSIWMRMVMHVTHDEVMRQWEETISKRSKKGRKVDWYSTIFFH